jgi:hypothetical protein
MTAVLSGCGLWSLIEREEHGLMLFEKRELRKVRGQKMDEVNGGRIKLHKEELRDLYSSPSIIRSMKPRRVMWAGHVARMGEGRTVYRLLVGKPFESDHYEDQDMCTDNIKLDL